MSKPFVHARNSAGIFGGVPADYIAIHEKMDQTKMVHASASHRCVFHSAYGVFLIEDIFGRTLTNSDGTEVSVRAVAEQHVAEDLGFIPSLSDWLHEMTVHPWMMGPSSDAESRQQTEEYPSGDHSDTRKQAREAAEDAE